MRSRPDGHEPGRPPRRPLLRIPGGELDRFGEGGPTRSPVVPANTHTTTTSEDGWDPMTTIHHINYGSLQTASGSAACHCLLLEDRNGLALVDTGIRRLDCRRPAERIGQPLIDAAGF